MTTTLRQLRHRLPVSVLIVAAFLLPFLLSSQQESLLTRALIFGIMAAGLDLAYGQAVSSWRLHFSVGFTF